MGWQAAARVAAGAAAVAFLLASPGGAQALSWSAPTTLYRGGADRVGEVAIAFDGRGRGLIGWSTDAAVRRRPGGQWRQLPATPLGGASLVAAGDGATAAGLISVRTRDGNERYYAAAARSSFGRRFGAIRPLDGRRLDSGPVDIAVNRRGDAAFTWVRDRNNRGSSGTVIVSVWRAGGSAPEPAEVVATARRDVGLGFSAVAIGDDGEVLVAWVTTSTCAQDSVVVRRSRRTGVWDRPRRVGPIVHVCAEEVELDIAAGPGRSAVVGWTSAGDLNSDLLEPEPVYAAVRRPDGSFTAPRKIGTSKFVDYPSEPPDFYASEIGPLRVAVTATREALVAWTGAPRRASRSIAAAAFGPDGRLRMRQSVLPESGTVVPTLLSLVVSRRGTATLLWRTRDYAWSDGPLVLASATRSPDGRFGAPATLVSTTSRQVLIEGDLAVPPDRELPTAVFLDERGILTAELKDDQR